MWPGFMESQPLSSVTVPRWTNQYIWMASQRSRGAWAGTQWHTEAIFSSSALRTGSVQEAAISSARAA